MLFSLAVLHGIRKGSIDLAFRRWNHPAVKPGTFFRTAIGIVEILSVIRTDADAISDEDAHRAGAESRSALLAAHAVRPDGDLYRITLRSAGADPRAALRETIPANDGDMAPILARLARFDAASRHGPWTTSVLALIAVNEGVCAADLAARVGRETPAFKANVRKLKELGLTREPRGRLPVVAARTGGVEGPVRLNPGLDGDIAGGSVSSAHSCGNSPAP